MDLFPYEPRLHQEDLVDLAGRLARSEAHGVVESGTGTGKTVCALAGTLPRALETGRRILYLTRTNSQQRQVVSEFRRIRERHALQASCVALQGRTHLCPLRDEDPEVGKAGSEELAIMCRDRCKAADTVRDGGKPPRNVEPCRFYANGTPERLDPFVTWARDAAPTAEELAHDAAERELCPYWATRMLLPDATVMVAPYIYLFHPGLRKAFLRWADADLADLHIIVDEAHNLPDYARALASATLTPRTLDLARREARRHGDTDLGGRTITGLLDTVERVALALADEYLPQEEDDALLPPGSLEMSLMEATKATTVTLRRWVGTLEEYGEGVREAKRKKGRVPRSYVGAVARFLALHLDADDDHARLVAWEEPGAPQSPVRLDVACLDPAPVTEVLLRCASSLHMSGTLRPLDAYRDSVGLPASAPCVTLPSPFPPHHRLLVVDPEVTTRFEEVRRRPDMWMHIGERVRRIREAVPDRNVMVFTPSYDVLARIRPGLGEDAILEEPGLPQDELMRRVARFKQARGATFGCVLGGRVAEGLDFPEKELEVAIIAGLPYPKPTAHQRALERYFDRRHGRGFEIASHAPMVRRTLQAVGRIVRTPEDKGVAVLLDKRAVLLSDDLPGLRVERDAAAVVRAFFDGDLAPLADGFTRAG